ncbi:hypothetical protein D3C73_624220 [compost metagenome]
MAAGGDRIEDAAGRADGQHAANAGLTSGDINAYLDEMSAKGGLLVGLGQLAPLDGIFANEAFFTCRFGQGYNLVAELDVTVLEHDLGRIDPELTCHGLPKLDAGGVNAGSCGIGTELTARSRRHRKSGVTKLYSHFIDTDAHHLGGGLGDDRVATGSDIGHIGLDGDNTTLIKPDPRPGRHDKIIAEGSRDTHADHPVSLAPCRGTCPFVPSELSRPKFQTPDEIAMGERPLRVFRIDLGIVLDAELDRIHAKLFCHLIDGNFERHQTGSFTWGSHGIALRQIERRELHGGHPVFTSIEQARLHHRRLRPTTRQIA